MSVTSNERMAPELSQFIIDKYQNMDASKQKEFLGIINEINATYAPFKRRTAILLRELVALTDARLIDVKELFAFSDVKLEYPSEQAKDLADALGTLPESLRLKFWVPQEACCRSTLSCSLRQTARSVRFPISTIVCLI